MLEIPVNSPFSYVGVLLLLFGLFLVLTGSGILTIEKITVRPGTKTWGVGAMFVVLGAGFLLVDTWNPLPQAPAPSSTTVAQFIPTVMPIPLTSTKIQSRSDIPTSELPTVTPVIPTPTSVPPTATPLPPRVISAPTLAAPTRPTLASPTPPISVSELDISVGQAIRDYYSLIRQKQYELAWEMAGEYSMGKGLSLYTYMSEWEESGAATIIEPIDVVEYGDNATVTLTLYYAKKGVSHRIRYELVRDSQRGSQRFGCWLFAKGKPLY